MKFSPKLIARQSCFLPFALGLFCLVLNFTTAQAARRPGAPRMIRFNWSDGNPGSLLRAGIVQNSGGSISHGVFGMRPSREGAAALTLYFTREENGAHNLWRAVPEDDPAKLAPEANREDAAQGAVSRDATIPPFRNVVWQATPLTDLTQGFFAKEAAPTPDGRALLCVTNAASSTPGDPASSQIARLDLSTGALSALTKNTWRNHSPAVAPDGSRFAFVSERGGVEAVFVMPMEGGTAWRVAAMARYPCWLDDSTLVYESTRSGLSGLYKISVPRNANPSTSSARARQVFTRPGEAAPSPDGSILAVASQIITTALGGTQSKETRLSILAADGSGERIMPGTEGARSPNFAPDGSAVIFDAPAAHSHEGATKSVTERALWLLPMLRVPPTASLLGVRPAPAGLKPAAHNDDKVTAVEVLGTVFTEDIAAPDVKLEFGEGDEPTRWKSLSVKQGPIHQGILTTWQLPADATGDWTLRLTVTDASGDTSQNTIKLSLPLELPSQPVDNAPVFAATFPTGVLPENAAPAIPAPPPPVRPAPVRTSPQTAPPGLPPPGLPLPAPPRTRTNPRAVTAPVAVAMSPVPILPLPVLPPAPPPTALPNPHWIPEPLPTQGGAATSPPGRAQSLPPLPGVRTFPRKNAARTAPSRPAKQPVFKVGADAARVSVRGTPAVMKVGESVPVTATLRNTGKQTLASHGSQSVRLIYRWINADTGGRNRWALTWLRQPLPRGGSTQLAFNLTAPPRPGRYRLIYSLLRLNGTEYEPPPFQARQDRWPSEFGTITYAVEVRGQ